MKATIGKRGILQLVATLALMLCALSPATGSVHAASSRYFPETGKTITDPFLSYWTGHGGLSQQGYPITDAQNEKNDADGKTYLTQYFERARFEYHPENNDPKFQVLLGLLGKEALAAKYGGNQPNSPAESVPGDGSKTFPETGKTVTGLFLDYWNTHGGLEQEGFPITEAYNEVNDADGQTYITQYFERARFEYHPENNDPKFQVLLGLVGREIYGLKQGSGSAAVPPPWAGVKIPTPLDTAFLPWTNDPSATRAYFVKDGGVSILDLKTKQLSTAPIFAQTLFPGLAFTTLTSAVAWPEGDPNYGTFLLFDGPVLSMFNMYMNQVVGAQPPTPFTGGQWIPGPVLPLETFFVGITSDYKTAGFDAAAAWPPNSKHANKTLVCVTSYCDFFDNTTHTEDFGTGGSFTTIWPGFPFDKDLDAIVPWPNGKVYFFKGDQYAVVDVATDKVDPGYPRPIN